MIQPKSDLEQAEEEIPTLARVATGKAFTAALEAGNSVLIADPKSGLVYEIHPDGRRDLVKQIEPGSPAQLGSIIMLR